MLQEFLTSEDGKINLLSAAVMPVKADKSEVIAPVLSAVIILPSPWSQWLLWEAPNKRCPPLSLHGRPGAAPSARGARGLLLSTDLRSLLALPPLAAGC